MLDRRSLLKYHPIHGIYKLMDAWVV